MNKEKKNRAMELKNVAGFVLIYGLIYGITYGIEVLYMRTDSIWWYFLYLNLKDSVGDVLGIIAWFFLITYTSPNKKEVFTAPDGTQKEMLYRQSRDFRTMKKIYLGVILAAAGYLVVFHFFPLSRRFSVCEINGQPTSRYRYKAAVLADALDDITQVAEIPADQIVTAQMSYSYPGYRGRSRTNYAELIAYQVEDTKYSTWLADSITRQYVHCIEGIEGSVRIEYYPRSGFVKTIDGFSPYDYDGLQANLSERQEAYQKEKRAEEAAQRAREQEEERRWSFTYDTMMNSVGKQISDIEQKFQRKNVPFEINLEYISTQYFEVGEVAYFDLPERTAYVVKDQNAEEMIAVPYISSNMTLPEVKEVLDAAGITYTWDDMIVTEGKPDEEKRLHTYHCSPGTLIPTKNYVYWFSVE